MRETTLRLLCQRSMMPLLAGLAMSLGWGIRGDYGHEAGAMLPGAMLALAIVLTAGRADWLARGGTLAMLGALGWAFGGQMSYGVVIGYTAAPTFADVLYGYASLFTIGALWGGIGAGLLALGLTWKRARLEAFVLPLVTLYALWSLLDLSGLTARLEERWSFHDTDWVAATTALVIAALFSVRPGPRREAGRLILTLAGGWWVGYGLLTLLLGLRMTPPRSDNWAGCAGLFLALVICLWREGNRAALLLVLYGLLAGGLGFAGGDFVQMLGRAGWGPIGRYEALQQLDYWKWMERLFGLVMGAGVGLGVRRLLHGELAPVASEPPARPLRGFALAVLLIVMPWENFVTNVRVWMEREQFRDPLLGLDPPGWILTVAILLTLTIAVAIHRHLDGALPMIPVSPFGRAQLLLLTITWLFVGGDFTRVISHLQSKGVLSVHVGFWSTAVLITLLVVTLPHAVAAAAGPRHDFTAVHWLDWRQRRRLLLGWILVPLFLFGLAKLTLATHGTPDGSQRNGLPGYHQRFGAPMTSRP
ncbi:MAG: hypothetical protein ACK496_16725 [Acidobacteriota bacterium]